MNDFKKRDGVTIKSKAIVLKENHPKKMPPKYKAPVVPSVQSTNALTMDLKTKKVYFATQSLSDLIEQFWLSSLTITGRGTRKARKLTTRSSTRQGKIGTRLDLRQKRRRKFL